MTTVMLKFIVRGVMLCIYAPPLVVFWYCRLLYLGCNVKLLLCFVFFFSVCIIPVIFHQCSESVVDTVYNRKYVFFLTKRLYLLQIS